MTITEGAIELNQEKIGKVLVFRFKGGWMQFLRRWPKIAFLLASIKGKPSCSLI